MDNTILDATSAHIHYFNRASGQSKTADDVNDFYLYKMYGWSEGERDRIYSIYGNDIHRNSMPYPRVAEVISQLHKMHEISFITARPVTFKSVTKEWLINNKINCKHLFFTEDKLNECNKLNVDVLIDDGPHYAKEFTGAGKPVILYDQPYNRDIKGKLIYRAYSWKDVLRYVEKLEVMRFE